MRRSSVPWRSTLRGAGRAPHCCATRCARLTGRPIVARQAARGRPGAPLLRDRLREVGRAPPLLRDRLRGAGRAPHCCATGCAGPTGRPIIAEHCVCTKMAARSDGSSVSARKWQGASADPACLHENGSPLRRIQRVCAKMAARSDGSSVSARKWQREPADPACLQENGSPLRRIQRVCAKMAARASRSSVSAQKGNPDRDGSGVSAQKRSQTAARSACPRTCGGQTRAMNDPRRSVPGATVHAAGASRAMFRACGGA